MSRKPRKTSNDDGRLNYLAGTAEPRRRGDHLYSFAAFSSFVLLFPFYWMVVTSLKPDAELLSVTRNPFWLIDPTLAHSKKLLFDTDYPALDVEHR